MRRYLSPGGGEMIPMLRHLFEQADTRAGSERAD